MFITICVDKVIRERYAIHHQGNRTAKQHLCTQNPYSMYLTTIMVRTKQLRGTINLTKVHYPKVHKRVICELHIRKILTLTCNPVRVNLYSFNRFFSGIYLKSS